MTSVPDHYQILGLRHGASEDDIKKAFKKLAIKYHPDKTSDKEHHALFIKINEAYETLKEAETRRAYDKTQGFASSGASQAQYSSYNPQQSLSSSSSSYTSSSTYTYSYGSSFRDGYFGVYQLYYRNPFANIFKSRAGSDNQAPNSNPFEKHYKNEFDAFSDRLRRAKAEKQNDFAASGSRHNYADESVKRETYEDQKKEEMRRQWESPFRQYDPDKLDEQYMKNRKAQQDLPTQSGNGQDESDPIVVEEEAAESDEEFVTVVEEVPETSPLPTPAAPFFQARSSLRSPEKLVPPLHTSPRTSYMRNEPPTNKRQKKDGFKFDDLKSSLGTSINDVDLADILDSLPDQKRQRSVSGQQTKVHPKRPKYEYLDGTTKADTLHIPVNKNSFGGYLAASPASSNAQQEPLTMLDLHASDKIHEYKLPVPPNVTVEPRMNEQQWRAYVADIQQYERQFFAYKKHIVQYQMERSEMDAEHYDAINSQPQSFEVYQQCLNQDMDVIQRYLDLLRVYGSTMELYKQNCKWMQLRR